MSSVVRPNPQLIKDTVADIIEAVARTVTFHYVSSFGPCPTCSGTDPFCVTCNGNPTTEVLATSGVLAAVKWKLGVLPESKRYRPEGQYPQGDCQLTIAYTDDFPTIIDSTRKVIVDGRDCVIRGYYFRGQPELINRIYVIVDEDDRTDSSYRI